MTRQPFFNTPERIATLAHAASHWRGTPWCANSDAPGPRGGVSCHNLPRTLYIASGALTDAFPKTIGYPNRHARLSVIEPFLNSRPEFMRVPLNGLQPGDLLGLRLYHCLDHLGVLLNLSDFIHVLAHKFVTVDSLTQDPTWSRRLLAAWRPVQ
jgi:cell wall-associated NlpC family hydrolase